MLSKKAFTLIELLVVIAIIAILAAILFPVFAQAKEAAKKTSCLSNEKQLSLGVLMYQNDFDDSYPQGTGAWSFFNGSSSGSFWGDTNWAVVTLPYIKSLGILGCPDDSKGSKVDPNTAWAGIMMSYAVNGLIVPWQPSESGQYCKGLMCEDTMSGGPDGKSVNEGTVHQPASVIMLSEAHSDALSGPNQTGYPNSPGANYSAGFGGIFTGYEYYENLQLPNQCGTADFGAPCGAYPWGQTGAVSVHGGNVANFSFADGHAKSMNPMRTVPNNAGPLTGAPWWLWGQFDTGAGDNTPSMWEADHD